LVYQFKGEGIPIIRTESMISRALEHGYVVIITLIILLGFLTLGISRAIAEIFVYVYGVL
jgi:hypothetical protein